MVGRYLAWQKGCQVLKLDAITQGQTLLAMYPRAHGDARNHG
jgi:hypothetical protein